MFGAKLERTAGAGLYKKLAGKAIFGPVRAKLAWVRLGRMESE
jgi:hypothetical protein